MDDLEIPLLHWLAWRGLLRETRDRLGRRVLADVASYGGDIRHLLAAQRFMELVRRPQVVAASVEMTSPRNPLVADLQGVR